MSSKQPTIWEADQHTLAKITLLQKYLVVWFKILGSGFPGRKLLYVDGFAGPGRYKKHQPGSPIAALSAAGQVLAAAPKGALDGRIDCAFVELDKLRYDHLEQELAPFRSDPRIAIHSFNSAFVDGVDALRSKMPQSFNGSSPLFVFIDPFGAKGSPMRVVEDILSSRTSEVLINFDADGISRIFSASSKIPGDALVLDEIFGDRSWKSRLTQGASAQTLAQDAVLLYMEKLRALPRIKYVYKFEMRSADDTVNYYLVFASQHPLGLEKMKETMRSISQGGEYCFSDARIGQERFFQPDSLAVWADRIHAAYRGRTVDYEELEVYTLNETPYSNPTAMLQLLKAAKKINADIVRDSRSLSKENVRSVTFIDPPPIDDPLTLF